MSSNSGSETENPTEYIFQNEISSGSSSEDIDVDIKHYSYNEKRNLYAEGLYDPGSGEICAKLLSISDSFVRNHLLFPYPAITDPGIKQALLKPVPTFTYPDDGQELYLHTCEGIKLRPLKAFYEGLLKPEIDLSYCGVISADILAMSLSLKNNKIVKTLNLTDNFFNDDACFHLREILEINITLVELNLSGCRIGYSGLDNLMIGLTTNSSLKILNLDNNRLEDKAMQLIDTANCSGMRIDDLYLSSNNLSTGGLSFLSHAFMNFNNLRKIDLSWNSFLTNANVIMNFLSILSENEKLAEVNLSWTNLTGQKVVNGLNELLKSPSLTLLDLSHNKISNITFDKNLKQAVKLVTLDLSFNPLTQEDALKLIRVMKLPFMKINKLLLDNVDVNVPFIKILKRLKLKRPKAVVTFGRVVTKYVPKGPDFREVVLKRVDYLLSKGRRRKADIALIALQLLKDGELLVTSQILNNIVREFGGFLDDDLVAGIAEAFPGGKPKLKLISVPLLVEYIKRLWPDRKLKEEDEMKKDDIKKEDDKKKK